MASQLKIERGLGIFTGGLLGACLFSQQGGSNAMVINENISCFYIDDHWSLKRQSGKTKISNKLLTQIAREALGLKKFEIIEKDSGIYNISEIKR